MLQLLLQFTKIIFTFKNLHDAQKYALTAKQKNLLTNLGLLITNITNLIETNHL